MRSVPRRIVDHLSRSNWGPLALMSLLSSGCSAPWHDAQLSAALKPTSRASDIELVDSAISPPASSLRRLPEVGRENVSQKETVRAESPAFDLAHPLTLDEVFNYTLDNHPLLRARHHEVDIQRGKLLAASLWTNPQLVLDTDSPVAGEDPTQLGGRLEFTIPTGGKRKAAQAVANAAIRRASYAVGREMHTVLVEAAAAGLEVMYLQEMVEQRKKLTELANEIAEMERALVGSVISEVQLLIADVDAADVEYDRLRSLSELEVARYRLSRAIGLVEPQPLTMTGRLTVEPVPRIPLEVVLQAAREARPEIKEAHAAVVEAQREVDLARAEAVPDIQFGPRWQDNIGRSDDTVGARVSTDLPVFNWNQGAIGEMNAQVCTNRALLQVAEINSLSDVASAYAQLQPIEQTIEFYEKKILPLADKTEAAIRATQATDVADPVRLSLQLRKLYQVRLNYLEMRYLHNQLRVRIELFLGCRIADLEQRMDPIPADGAVIETEELPAGPEKRS
jgi:outer membrane protein, heavy metal efflux system